MREAENVHMRPSAKQLLHHHILAGMSTSQQLTPFRLLRGQLDTYLEQPSGKSVAFVSSFPEEGTTTIAINVALLMATYVNTVYVEGNFGAPRVAEMVGASEFRGVEEYLTQSMPWQECSLSVFNPAFQIMCAHPGHQDLLASPRMLTLVQRLKESGALSIFDLPPVLSTDASYRLLSTMDGIVLVIKQGTSRDIIDRTMSILRQWKLVGTVLNAVSFKDKGY